MFPPPLHAPAGYELRHIGEPATLIARVDVVETLAAAIEEQKQLIAFAAAYPGARPLQGRQTAYAIPIGQLRGVVRRNHHGGALRKWTGSVFLWPTRAPKELAISMALRQMRILTPVVLGIAIYRTDFIAAMSDVVTEEIQDSEDFGAVLLETRPGSDDREKAWDGVIDLLARLSSAGVRHHDLNVKNILLRRNANDSCDAWLLDVDRVKMNLARREADTGNRSRLLRSIEKWRDTRGAQVSGAEIEILRRKATSIP